VRFLRAARFAFLRSSRLNFLVLAMNAGLSSFGNIAMAREEAGLGSMS
jgi:hypothetical protein